VTEPESSTSEGGSGHEVRTPERPDTGETETRASRKQREGLVTSAKMDKTVVVAVIDRVQHRRYRKTLQRTRKLYAHDEANEVREGDKVRIVEMRPMSRLKRWRVVEIMERAR
jgi:small subunit ribosomal protein S17